MRNMFVIDSLYINIKKSNSEVTYCITIITRYR